MSQGSHTRARVTREQIARVLGRIDDAKAAAIIASGATLRELEQAAAWAVGESDVMAKVRSRASPAVAKVYDILTTEDTFPEDRE